MILCFEGINGAGKSTLASRVAAEWARQTGGSVTVVDPVQRTEFGRVVRYAIMEGTEVDPIAEALAFVSARLDGLADIRKTYEEVTDLILVERWSGAVAAYGRADAGDASILDRLEDLLWHHGRFPTVFVDVTGSVADRRLSSQSDRNKFETRGSAYLERVRGHYRDWACRRDVPILDPVSWDAVEYLVALLKEVDERNG